MSFLKTDTVEVPGWPGVPVVIRKLAGRHLEAARQAHFATVQDAYRRIAAWEKEVGAIDPPKDDADAPKKDDAPPVVVDNTPSVLGEFDPYTVVAKGVLTIDGKEPAAGWVDESCGVDEMEFLHERILRLSLPRRFETEADAKNVSAPSGTA